MGWRFLEPYQKLIVDLFCISSIKNKMQTSLLPLEIIYEIFAFVPEYGFSVNHELHSRALEECPGPIIEDSYIRICAMSWYCDPYRFFCLSFTDHRWRFSMYDHVVCMGSTGPLEDHDESFEDDPRMAAIRYAKKDLQDLLLLQSISAINLSHEFMLRIGIEYIMYPCRMHFRVEPLLLEDKYEECRRLNVSMILLSSRIISEHEFCNEIRTISQEDLDKYLELFIVAGCSDLTGIFRMTLTIFKDRVPKLFKQIKSKLEQNVYTNFHLHDLKYSRRVIKYQRYQDTFRGGNVWVYRKLLMEILYEEQIDYGQYIEVENTISKIRKLIKDMPRRLRNFSLKAVQEYKKDFLRVIFDSYNWHEYDYVAGMTIDRLRFAVEIMDNGL